MCYCMVKIACGTRKKFIPHNSVIMTIVNSVTKNTVYERRVTNIVSQLVVVTKLLPVLAYSVLDIKKAK